MGTSKKYTVKPYIAPVKGLNYSIPGTLLKDDGMTDCRNVRIDRYNCVAKRSGYEKLGNNLPLDGIVLVGAYIPCMVAQIYRLRGLISIFIRLMEMAHLRHTQTMDRMPRNTSVLT